MGCGLHVPSSSLLDVKRRTSIPFLFHACHAFSASPDSFKRRRAVGYNSGAPLKMWSLMPFTECKQHRPPTSGLQQNYILGLYICWSFSSPFSSPSSHPSPFLSALQPLINLWSSLVKWGASYITRSTSGLKSWLILRVGVSNFFFILRRKTIFIKPCEKQISRPLLEIT